MNSQELNELMLLNRTIRNNIDYTASLLEQWKLDAANRQYGGLITQITKMMNQLQLYAEPLREFGIEPDLQEFMSLLSDVVKAQQNQDYILLGDLLMLSMKPFFEQLQQQMGQIMELQPADHLDRNLAMLDDREPELAQLIRAYLVSEQYEEDASKYSIESTTSGFPTIKRIREGEEFYLNSNQNPRMALRKWLVYELKNDAQEYHMLGVGMGHAYSILFGMVNSSFPIHFYETDIYVLTQSLRYENISGPIQEYIHIHYDPDLKQLLSVIKDKRCQFFLYQPAIRNIDNSGIRAAIEKYYVAKSSAREMDLSLRGNFYMNQKAAEAQQSQGNYHNVEELVPAFLGKEVYIIAAGPSLDKNLLQLKERDPQSVLIATGTVYKKLLRVGILPDYVIISEANRRVMTQVMLTPELVSEQTKKIPLIVLATTSPAICNAHPGPKYVALQYEFDLSEQKAAEEGRTLFMTGGSVSTTAFDVAVRLGAKKVVFLGLDLAFTDHKAHAAGTSSQNVPDEQSLSRVKGFYGDINIEDTVLTDYKFTLYRDWFRRRMQMEDVKQITVINATEGGAYLIGMRHMSLAEAMQLPF